MQPRYYDKSEESHSIVKMRVTAFCSGLAGVCLGVALVLVVRNLIGF